MSVRIRLRRIGKNPKKKPHFRISVFDSHKGRDGRFLEEIGFYNPTNKSIKVKKERYEYWINKGAQPSETVRSLISKSK